MNTKKWYQSKTIWLNAISAILATIGIFNQDLLIGLGFTNPTKFLAILGSITTVLNIILRLLTTTAISTLPTNSLIGPGGGTNPDPIGHPEKPSDTTP